MFFIDNGHSRKKKQPAAGADFFQKEIPNKKKQPAAGVGFSIAPPPHKNGPPQAPTFCQKQCANKKQLQAPCMLSQNNGLAKNSSPQAPIF